SVFAVSSAAQLLRYRIGDDPVVETNVGRILREAERLNALVASLLEYGRPAPLQIALGDPDAVWTKVVDAARGASETKSLAVQLSTASPRAQCAIDTEQLGHAF